MLRSLRNPTAPWHVMRRPAFPHMPKYRWWNWAQIWRVNSLCYFSCLIDFRGRSTHLPLFPGLYLIGSSPRTCTHTADEIHHKFSGNNHHGTRIVIFGPILLNPDLSLACDMCSSFRTLADKRLIALNWNPRPDLPTLLCTPNWECGSAAALFNTFGTFVSAPLGLGGHLSTIAHWPSVLASNHLKLPLSALMKTNINSELPR